MRQWSDWKTVAIQSPIGGLPWIDTVAPDRETRQTATKIEVGVAVGLSGMSHGTPIVFVLDSDVSGRELLEPLFFNAGWRPVFFESAREFLHPDSGLVPSCLILDITHLNADDVGLQECLAADRKYMPIIFVADHGDVAMSVRAMKAGAFDFLAKPFCNDALLTAVRQAIEHSKTMLEQEVEMSGLRDCYTSLSRREWEVMSLVVSGLLNKQAGFELGISEVTVKAHRGRVMRKMKANSFADLVKMAERLRVTPAGLGCAGQT